MDNPESKIETLWKEAAAKLAQAGPEDRERIRESYVRRAVRTLEEPEYGGYVVEDLSALTRPADSFERQYIKRAFKRLHDRGELAKVEPVGDGLLYRLAG